MNSRPSGRTPYATVNGKDKKYLEDEYFLVIVASLIKAGTASEDVAEIAWDMVEQSMKYRPDCLFYIQDKNND